MEFFFLFFCKGFLFIGEVSFGVVWGGCFDRKGFWEDFLF